MQKLTPRDIFHTVAEVLQIPEIEVTMDLSPSTCEKWDSLAQLNIISELDSSLGIEFEFDDFEKIKDMKSLIEVIKKTKGDGFEI